jgi:hypothetical protein
LIILGSLISRTVPRLRIMFSAKAKGDDDWYSGTFGKFPLHAAKYISSAGGRMAEQRRINMLFIKGIIVSLFSPPK